MNSIAKADVGEHLLRLNQAATEAVLGLPGVRLIGPEDPALRGGVLNLVIEDIDPHQVAMVLDQSSRIMVRAGYNCAHSWYHATATPESLRASLSIYNTIEEVETLSQRLGEIVRHFR